MNFFGFSFPLTSCFLVKIVGKHDAWTFVIISQPDVVLQPARKMEKKKRRIQLAIHKRKKWKINKKKKKRIKKSRQTLVLVNRAFNFNVKNSKRKTISVFLKVIKNWVPESSIAWLRYSFWFHFLDWPIAIATNLITIRFHFRYVVDTTKLLNVTFRTEKKKKEKFFTSFTLFMKFSYKHAGFHISCCTTLFIKFHLISLKNFIFIFIFLYGVYNKKFMSLIPLSLSICCFISFSTSFCVVLILCDTI